MSSTESRLNNSLAGAAGVHFVAFHLTLRGLIVLPTIRNTAGIDLLVCDPSTGAQASLQVKTSMKRVSFWPTSIPHASLRGPNHFHIFLRVDENGEPFEAYLELSDRVALQVEANLEDHRKRKRQEFAYWGLPGIEEAKSLQKAWDKWAPPKLVAVKKSKRR